jgi:hypothetical protein
LTCFYGQPAQVLVLKKSMGILATKVPALIQALPLATSDRICPLVLQRFARTFWHFHVSQTTADGEF